MSDLVADNVNMTFTTHTGSTVHALKNINFTLKQGQLLSVLGPSGCGKTTLLNIIAGFLHPTSGRMTLGDHEITGPALERGMVFQQGALFEWLTVADNVNFGLRMKKADKEESARKVEEGGSLTIFATALVDTGSRLDEVIFEEFKGTGNLEIVLDRSLVDLRIWPAIEISRSGTRREEMLMGLEEHQKVCRLRQSLSEESPTDAMKSLISQLSKTQNNAEFLLGLKDDH